MAVTLAQRMTRYLKRHNGVVPPEHRAQYRAWRQGNEQAALELLAETETEQDLAEDQADLQQFEAEEALRTIKSDVTFMVAGDEPLLPPRTVEPARTQDAPAPDARRMEENPAQSGRRTTPEAAGDAGGNSPTV